MPQDSSNSTTGSPEANTREVEAPAEPIAQVGQEARQEPRPPIGLTFEVSRAPFASSVLGHNNHLPGKGVSPNGHWHPRID